MKSPQFVFDVHLDLAMNALEWNRDYTRPLTEIRAREAHLKDKPDRGHGTVCFPEMRRAGVGLCVATQIARYVKPGHPLPGWHSPEQAWAMTQAQLAWYRAMEARGEMRQIRNLAELYPHVRAWRNADGSVADGRQPIGFILSLEGADSIVSLKHLELSVQQGLRMVGPAHYGPGTYAFGTDSDAPLSPKGRELLREMDRLGLILDVTHLCDTAFWQALEIYEGPIWASHHLVRALVPNNRQLSDEMIRALVKRGAVIGGALDAWMLVPNWVRGQTTPESSGVKLEHLVNHIDYVCQLAGNTNHSGLGTDLDGAFGTEQTPGDLDSIADIQKLPELFQARGYSEAEVQNILSRNFLGFLGRAWAKAFPA